MKNFQLTLGILLLFVTSFNTEVAFGATATGRLACMDATTSSNLIYVEFSGAGTTGANLYRHGAPSFIASYPNRDSGAGSHNDTGLGAGSAYRYELRSGTQVLANVTCSTKAAAQPAPTATTTQPTQSPTSTSTSSTPTSSPTSSTPTPASSPSASPTSSSSSPTPATSPVSRPRAIAPVFQSVTQEPIVPPILATVPENQVAVPVEAKPDPIAAISGTTLPPPTTTTQFAASNNSTIPTSYLTAIFFAGAAGLLLLKSIRKADLVAETAAPPAVPPPIFLASVPTEMLEQSISANSPATVHRPDNIVSSQFDNQSAEPNIPMRTYAPQHASQLHRQLQPANPYSDRTKLR